MKPIQHPLMPALMIFLAITFSGNCRQVKDGAEASDKMSPKASGASEKTQGNLSFKPRS